MAFKKGEPRPTLAGRKKGSLNKVTRFNVKDALESAGKNPALEILMLMPHLDPPTQLRAWTTLLEYVDSKAKIDMSLDIQNMPKDQLASQIIGPLIERLRSERAIAST